MLFRFILYYSPVNDFLVLRQHLQKGQFDVGPHQLNRSLLSSLRDRTEPRRGGRWQPQPHEPRGALQAHDVSTQRARILRGAAAAPLPAGQQHGTARTRSVRCLYNSIAFLGVVK